jgi:hypothetical protein
MLYVWEGQIIVKRYVLIWPVIHDPDNEIVGTTFIDGDLLLFGANYVRIHSCIVR